MESELCKFIPKMWELQQIQKGVSQNCFLWERHIVISSLNVGTPSFCEKFTMIFLSKF
ncbi:hypothetical protein LEP1GSC016_1517 [Leptospira borgpetersenii serovar Hardjo-bovis str. Sponselee]|uniref:Uncharacterized protein n=1 Tax=Leptospira borgpetersenii serovar Hardjo-bovis str. Sponselee TaxID=1303729 RepID=M6BQJ4_LEPBO|nr:hypothetical protein LEP1GSC016_1517 [Leptospira borgpetersenii serovar Hardjo-bovis str. Sponselee]